MKILHVETGRHLYGGPQQVIYLTKALLARGINNILVCLPGSGIDNAARDAGVTVRNLKCVSDYDLAFAFRLRQLVLSEKPDIIHCHSRRGGDFLGGLAATGVSIPAVISRRVDNTESPWIAKLRYKPFCKIIAISNTIANVLRASGITEERLTVIRSAVDTEQFKTPSDRVAFQVEFNLSNTDIVLATIAQLIPRKGHRYMLEAVAQLKNSYPHLKVIIFGQGSLEAALRKQTAKLGLEETVKFSGYRQDLDDYLACLDLLIHPALTEGLGVAALKASAAGVPVVGFAAGGLSEVVANGETGLLVPPKDVEALRVAITKLIEDPALRRKFGDTGRLRMQHDFSIESMVDDHVQLYESILNVTS